jgi:hypothetical protein
MDSIYDYEQLTKAIREGQVIPERSGEYWCDDEQEKMTNLYNSGVGISQIALELQRSEMAVIQRLITENLLTPPGAARKRTTKAPHCLCEECSMRRNCRQRKQNQEVCHAGDL